MAASPISLLYTSAHEQHAPKTEFNQGDLIPYMESPERPRRIYQHLRARGLGEPVPARRIATFDDLLAVHTLPMLDYLEALSHSVSSEDQYLYADFFPIRAGTGASPRSLGGRMGRFCTDPYSPVGRGTWAALCAAGGLALQGAEMLLRRETLCAYVLSRPPGHHAGSDFFGSYCYINPAALAAQRLLSAGQVAILDVDYHHGNGTQAIFWEEPRVLYTSLHIDPNLDFPYYSGYADETGGVQAPGSTYNIPLPPNTPTASYLAALDALLNAIRAFHPAALVISLGFDPYQGDPLSAFRLGADAYTEIGRRAALLNLPTLFIQEGGYALDALPELAENWVTGFLNGTLEANVSRH